MPVTDIERVIRESSVDIADKMLQVAAVAKSEEDVRIGCTLLITAFFSSAGIESPGQHEYGLAGGRIDSLYRGVIIEYKDPNSSAKIASEASVGTRAVVKQIQGRFVDFKKHENIDPDRLIGVGCDARQILFVRHRSGKFEIDAPQPVTHYSIARLLRALVSLGASGNSYTPNNLARDFAEGSNAAKVGVNQFLSAIRETSHPKAKTFFRQWQIMFGEVCGYDVTGNSRSESISKLCKHYGVETPDAPQLLFAIHSYYAILIKFLAAEIAQSFSPLGASTLKKCNAEHSDNVLRNELVNLERGGIWAAMGITNFLEGDLFSWYLDAWNAGLADAVRGIVTKLDEYDPTTLSVDEAGSRDLLKKLYHLLFPRSVRHDLGEYYTPDWLAEYTLDQLGYDGNPNTRLLDPACGSGTFLVMAINRIKRWYDQNRDQCGYGEGDLLKKILDNVIGFDLNPLAVMAARTNYLIAVRELLKFAPGVELPVYLCDAVKVPEEPDQTTIYGQPHRVATAAGIFYVPAEITEPRERIGKYAELIESCIRNDYDARAFLAVCQDNGLPIANPDTHRTLYERISALNKSDENGMWARIIKNSFAPRFIERVDVVVGNPPWVNWQSLPANYRDDSKQLWQRYGLFTLSGKAARLGGGKKDLSMLFVYTSADLYLKDEGKLGFVITQTIFKSRGAGDGFRRFWFRDVNDRETLLLSPIKVHDLGVSQVFEGATNRAALFFCTKKRLSAADLAPVQREVPYPVDYALWRGPRRIDQDALLADVLRVTSRQDVGAVPIDGNKITSPWLTAPVATLPALRKIIGRSDYEANAGCSTWLNGVFWVRVIGERPNGDLVIENMHDVGKIEVEHVEAVIERNLVYPLLRGRNISRWHAEPSAYFILTQDPVRRNGIPEDEMMRAYRKTYAYLKNFEEVLRSRSGFKRYFKPSTAWRKFTTAPRTSRYGRRAGRVGMANLRYGVLVIRSTRYTMSVHTHLLRSAFCGVSSFQSYEWQTTEYQQIGTSVRRLH